MTYATSMYPIKCMLVPRIPNNDGLVRPLHVSAPEGSIVNCTFPAPVKARAKVMKHIVPLIFGALAPLLPEEVIAAAGGIFPFQFHGDGPALRQFQRARAATRRHRRDEERGRLAARGVPAQLIHHAGRDHGAAKRRS